MPSPDPNSPHKDDNPKPDEKGTNPDDAMIEKPKDDAFEHHGPDKTPPAKPT